MLGGMGERFYRDIGSPLKGLYRKTYEYPGSYKVVEPGWYLKPWAEGVSIPCIPIIRANAPIRHPTFGTNPKPKPQTLNP